MRELTGWFVVTWEFFVDDGITLGIGDGLSEDGLHAAITGSGEDMGSVNGCVPSIIGAVEAEDEFIAFDGGLNEDVSWCVVDESEIGEWNVDGGVHTIGFVVLDGVSVVVSHGDLEAGVQCSPEGSGRYLTDTTTKLRGGLVLFDDELWKVSMFAVDGAELFDE